MKKLKSGICLFNTYIAAFTLYITDFFSLFVPQFLASRRNLGHNLPLTASISFITNKNSANDNLC